MFYKRKNMKELTIVLLTYNRKARLLKQLHSLYIQPESKDVQIVIIDNHSDYDVYDAVKAEFGEEKISNLKVIVNPVNFGMEANLATPFLHCSTDWLWTLSDDDITEPDSIATILNDIKAYPETAVFKYQINTEVHGYRDTVISTLPELIDFYLEGNAGSGHLIFLSNNVYNLKKAMEHYGPTLSHCYSCIAQMLPMFHILDSKAGCVRMRSKILVNFVLPEPGTGYPYLYTAVEISSTVMFQFNLSNEYYRKLGFLVTNGFSHYRLCLSALEMDDRKRGRFLYEQVYSRAYRHSGFLIDKLYHWFYYFCYITHFKVSHDRALMVRTKMRKFFPHFR